MVTPEGANPSKDTHLLPPSLPPSLRHSMEGNWGELGTDPLASPEVQSSRTMGSLVLAGCEGAGREMGGLTAISGGFTFRGKLGLRAARRISR